MSSKATLGFLAACLAVTVTSSAQRKVDLAVTLTSPSNGAVLTGTQAFNASFNVTNNGPDTLRATDTLAFYFTLDNGTNPVQVYVNGSAQASDNFASIGTAIPPNAGGPVNLTVALATAPSAGAHTLCLNALVINRGANPVKDSITANNKSCANVTFTGATAVASVEPDAELAGAAYPNPASGAATVDLNLPRAQPVSYTLSDATGRVVRTADQGLFPAGASRLHLDAAQLPAGLYVYRVRIGGQAVTGKLQLVR